MKHEEPQPDIRMSKTIRREVKTYWRWSKKHEPEDNRRMLGRFLDRAALHLGLLTEEETGE